MVDGFSALMTPPLIRLGGDNGQSGKREHGAKSRFSQKAWLSYGRKRWRVKAQYRQQP
jgi:hypothetical protein